MTGTSCASISWTFICFLLVPVIAGGCELIARSVVVVAGSMVVVAGSVVVVAGSVVVVAGSIVAVAGRGTIPLVVRVGARSSWEWVRLTFASGSIRIAPGSLISPKGLSSLSKIMSIR